MRNKHIICELIWYFSIFPLVCFIYSGASKNIFFIQMVKLLQKVFLGTFRSLLVRTSDILHALKDKPSARLLSFTLRDVQTLVVSVEITQHAPTHSSPTMPSCYRITCPPKRPSFGSSSDIPNTRTRALIQLIFGSCCTAHNESDTWEGKLDQTKIIKSEQVFFSQKYSSRTMTLLRVQSQHLDGKNIQNWWAQHFW